MKIAYLILAYKNANQIIRLVQRLMTENSLFLIHVDKKSSQSLVEEIKQSLDRYPNVSFIKKRIKCYWGGFGIVEATLQGIRELFTKEFDFDRLILLSAQDYPIKSTEQLENFLKVNTDMEFISCDDYKLPPNKSIPSSGTNRIHYWHFSIGKIRLIFPGKLEYSTANLSRVKKYKSFKLFSIFWNSLIVLFPVKRKVPSGLNYFIGSQFWCLTRSCVNYIYEFVNANPKFVNFFKYTDIPDESFFQTVVMNSPFSKHVENHNLHYIDWENPNPSLPKILVLSDFERLMSSHKFFARKFDVQRDVEILDLIDKKVFADKLKR